MSLAEMVDDMRDVVAEIVGDDSRHGAGGSCDTTRLGPKDAVAGTGQGGRERLEVITAVPAVGREDDDGGPVAVRRTSRSTRRRL